MAMKVNYQSNLSVVTRQMLGNLDEAGEQLKKDAVEWVQEQMLYGYNDPHGPDRHTEIYWSGHMIEDTIKADTHKDSQNVMTVSVGSDAPYAVYVHQGTHKLKGRPFLRDALEKHRADIEQIAKDNLAKGF